MNKSIQRIKAVLLQDLYQTRHSGEVFMDVGLFPIINVALFGFISLYFASRSSSFPAQSLLIAAILWETLRVVQYTVSVGTLWNVWSRNLTNVFISPISIPEYFLAFSFSGIVKVLILYMLLFLMAVFLFGLRPNSAFIGNMVLYFINLAIVGISFGIFITGMIFKWGTKVNSLAWGMIYFFQPFSGVFFPVSVLPSAIRPLAYLFPMTYVFESARSHLTGNVIDFASFIFALGLNIVYLALAYASFVKFYNDSRRTGQFARNEG